MKVKNPSAAKNLLAFIQDYYARHRAMPSFAEVGKLVGLSVSTVAFHVTALKEHGFLGATETGRLVPGKAFFRRELVSTVSAGMLAYADDSAPEGMLIDEYLIDAPSRTFLLTVKGESMRDAGLLPGDVVVVKRGALACPGDIVVVNTNGEGTVKELAQNSDGDYYLKARNPAYPDIVPAEGFEIMGVVVGEFRRYVRAKATLFSVPAEPKSPQEKSSEVATDTAGASGFRGTSIFQDLTQNLPKNERLGPKVATPSKEKS